jgi:hypothetical protein
MTKEERLAYYETYGGKLFNERQKRLAEMEGWRHKGYFPKNKDGSDNTGSGITVGYGIDLSQIKTVDALVDHGINRATAEKWKELGVLGKTLFQLQSEEKAGGPSVGSLKLKVSIPNTESQKADIAINTFKVVDKKLEKYQGKISDELYVSLSSQLHFNGGFGKISSDGFNDKYAINRKAHASALVWKEIDDWIEKNPDGVVPDELVYSVYQSNKFELEKSGSPLNATTYERDSLKLLKDLGITEDQINAKIKNNEDIDFDPQLDTKWKQDLFDKIKETVNSEGKELSNEDLTIFSDQIDGMTYEEAKNEFGIKADDVGDGFSINIGPETLRSKVNTQTTKVKTADVKARLEAIIKDSNSSPQEIEDAKEKIKSLDENLKALEDSENIVLDNLIPMDPNDPRYQHEQSNIGLVTGGSTALVETIDDQLDKDYGEQTTDEDGNIVNIIGKDRVREGEDKVETEVTAEPYEFDVREARKLGLMYDKDGRTYDPEQLENMFVKPEGLMDYEEYAGWLSKKEEDPNASFDDYHVSDDDLTPSAVEDETAETEFDKWLKDNPGGTREEFNKYYDLRGDGSGLGEESFLDKVGGLSSLIGLATGAIGMGEALKDVDIPKDPKLGPAFQQRLEESKRLAQQGLTPSELAKAHNDLDSSYATGIENIVRGSAGNRAQFMAGLGGLDVARQSALMDIAVADASMQRKNQEKYDSMMLMNEQYEAARQSKYQNAKFEQDTAKQAAGAALAGASISMVNDAIGSRHINRYNKLKSEQLMQQMGYKATKDGKSGQDNVYADENGDDVQTSWNLLSSDDQAVEAKVDNQGLIGNNTSGLVIDWAQKQKQQEQANKDHAKRLEDAFKSIADQKKQQELIGQQDFQTFDSYLNLK